MSWLIKEDENGCNMSLFDVGALLWRVHGASYIVLRLETFVFLRCQNNMHSLGEILFAFFTVEKLLKLLFFSNSFIAEYLFVSLSHLIPQNWMAISSDLLVYIL